MINPPDRPTPGDLIEILAQFHEPGTNFGIVIAVVSPATGYPGYQVLMRGKKKYFPPHLIRIVSRKKQSE